MTPRRSEKTLGIFSPEQFGRQAAPLDERTNT
jgi:hypothetical protein